MQVKFFLESIELALLVSFFLLSSLLFSGVSIEAKLILLQIIFFLVVLEIYKYQKFNLNINFIPTRILIYYLILFIYLIINAFLLSKIVYDSKIELSNFFIYVITFLTILLVKKENFIKSLIYTFFIINFVVFLFYIFNPYDRQKMIYYFFYNPNIFSGICVMNTFFSYDCIRQNTEYKNVAIINFVLSLLLILLLKSYSAIFVTITLIIFLLKKFYNISPATILISCVSLLTIFSTLNFQTVLDRTWWLFVGSRVFLKNIFFGVGLGNFKYFYLSNTTNLPSYSIATSFVHNYFLQFSSETGIIGLILFLLFVTKVITKNKNKNFFFYSIIAILILNFFDYNLYIPQNSILLFSMFAGYIKVQEYNFNLELIFKYTYFVILLLIFVIGLYITKNLNEINKLFKNPEKQNLEKIISIDKTSWEAYINLSKIYFIEKNFPAAIENLNSAIKYNPQYSETYFYLALIYKVLKKDSYLSYKYLSKAINLNPKAGTRYIKYFKLAESNK